MERRHWVLGVLFAAGVLVQPVAATPPESVSGTVILTSSTITSVQQAGPNTIITAVNTLVLTGDVSGTATFEFRQVNHADGSINSNGIVTCACTIDGESGTVVLRVEGTGSLGPPIVLSGRAVVVAADGGLEGLHGVFTFDQTGTIAPYEGRIHVEP